MDKSPKKLREIYGLIDQPVFVIDVDDDGFRFVILNETYEKTVGLMAETVAGKRPQDCLPLELAIQVEANYQRCLEARSTIRYNEVVFGRYWNTTLVPKLDDDGRVCRIVGTAIEITKEIGIERLLRPALQRGELAVEYQPICRLDDGSLQGFEALIRWPGSGFGPGDFLPVARVARLMGALNRFVIETVVAQIKALPEPIWVGINLSEFDVSAMIARSLKRWGVERRRLWLEVTEDAKITERIADELAGLRLDGHKIKLDDFGTERSNLLRLQELPCDGLKIDRAFVDGVATDKRKQTICLASLLMASEFELCTIAEGIENEADRAWLLAQGCQLGQGWLFGKPVPGKELETFVRI